MVSVCQNNDRKLWRLDSLADAARCSEWKEAAALAEKQPSLAHTISFEKKKKGLFSSIKSKMSELMPFGLNSTVKSTRGNLKRLLTTQLAAMPTTLPDGEGFDTLEDDEFAGFDTVQQELDAADIDFAAAFNTASAEAQQDNASDLVAKADAAIAALQSPTAEHSFHSIPEDDVADLADEPERKHSSCFAKDVPDVLRATVSHDGASSAAVSPTSSSGPPSSRPSSALGSSRPSMRNIRSMKSSRSLGLPRARTLQRMETCNAWWELHEMEVAEQIQVDADDASFSSSNSRNDNADSSAVADNRVITKASSQTSRSGSMSSTVIKTLANMSVSSWSSGIASRLGSLLQSMPSGPVYSATLKKTAHTTLSTDGWTLHLVHTTDTALQPEQRKIHPILMCPGLASSGPGTYDLLPKVSLVDFLAAEGYDVWVIDIRGNGLADKTSRVDIEQDWNIDDYLVQDVPACIEYVLKHSPTKADKLHWMGHSMGGMLGSGLCSQAGKWGKKLRSVSLVGSGCFGDGSWHCLLKKLVVPVVNFGFPAHLAAQGMALLANTPAALSVFETLFYWCPNMEKPTRKALLSTCFNFIPQKLVGQFLESHGSATGLSNARGTFLYADPYVLARCKVPVLGLNGDWDLFCPAAGGERNVMLFGGYKKHLSFGPAFGHQYHYGHFDVIIGRNAQHEVWPHIREFLEMHDAPATIAELWPGLDF